MSDDRRAFFRGLVRSAAEMTGPPPAPPEAPSAPADPDSLRAAEVDRYSRQLVLPEWSERAQLALREASVLVVGAGALGSPVAAYLTGAGVGRVGLVDSDEVEVSNLPRQWLHFTPDVGVAKAESAAAKLRFLNPEAIVEPYYARFAPAMLEGADLVVDCSDCFETRYEVNAACCAARIPLVEGGVLGLSGLVMAIRPGVSACYRCAFPEAPPVGAELRGGRRARPGGGRDRLAAGARGAEAAGRARRRAARRFPPGRPPRPRRSCASPRPAGRTARTVPTSRP